MSEQQTTDEPLLRASVDLAADAFAGTVKTVEGVHQSIVNTIVRVNPAAKPVGWVSKFVYGRVQAIGQLSFAALGQAAGLAQVLRPGALNQVPEESRLGLQAALNGAFGDHLEAQGNRLAFEMGFYKDGKRLALTAEALRNELPEVSNHLVILLHGLCLNETQWRHAGAPDFGDRLETDLGYTALRVRYNTGRHISTNGRDFSQLMQDLIQAYPKPIKRLTVVGHSMGGLVARSACYYAAHSKHDWHQSLTEMICLGSPHLGAPLERLGHWFTHSLTRTPFTLPLSGLGKIRSAGIKDLRYCYLRDTDWQDRDLDAREAIKPDPLPLLEHVRYFNVAASLGKSANDPLDRLLGDLLVPIKSATTTPEYRSRRMAGKGQEGRVFFSMSHFELMHAPGVYAAIHEWLSHKSNSKSQNRLPHTSRRPVAH